MTIGKMHADEIYTDAALVRRLLLAQFPNWAALPITRVHSAGTDNALYRLGDDMLVRLPRIHWAYGSIDKEHQWLPWLAARLPITIPVPLAKGKPGEGYPWQWSVYNWLEGENPVVGHLVDPDALAMEIVEFLKALWRVDTTNGPVIGETLKMKDAKIRNYIASSRGMIDIEAVTQVWEATLNLSDISDPPVWIHGDLAPGNILLHNDRLKAIIDWSATGVGDLSDDLRIAWNLLPRDTRPAFRAALQIDDVTWARGRGRALAQALGQLPYYHITNPPLAANARYVISEVLADFQYAGK